MPELVRTLVGNQSSQSLKSNWCGQRKRTTDARALRAGDNDAFKLVVQRYGSRMLATARRFLTTNTTHKNAVQEAFASAFRALDKFNGEAMLSSWLHRIVVNAALVNCDPKSAGASSLSKSYYRALTRTASGSTIR